MMRAWWLPAALSSAVFLMQGQPEPSIEISSLRDGRHPVSVVQWRDIVFGGTRRYTGYWLSDVLVRIPGYAATSSEETFLVFRTRDGYNPLLFAKKLSERKGFVAVSNTPTGEGWVEAGPKKVLPGPAYVIWERTTQTEVDTGYPWPYQVTKIELVSRAAVLRALEPTGRTTFSRGARLYQEHCMTCHGSNSVGGTMGPDLKVMLASIGGWDTDTLTRFIRHPSSIVPKSKMQEFDSLLPQSIAGIVDYLDTMRKIQQKH
jgi:cytochrome c2